MSGTLLQATSLQRLRLLSERSSIADDRARYELGKMTEGYLADLTVFDDDFVVRGVVERGKWVPRNFQDHACPIKSAPTPT